MSEENIRKELQTILRKAPKPQLHIHLDGSLSFSFIQEAIQRFQEKQASEGKKVFFENDWQPKNHEELRRWLMGIKANRIADSSSVQKNSNWKVFDFCNQFLQTKEDLTSMTRLLVTSLFREHGVNYIEVRFAPVLHTLEGLTEQEAVSYVACGFREAVEELEKQDVEVHGGLILCALRSYSLSKAFETLELCVNKVDKLVLGFDIAGDEGAFPLNIFTDVLRKAKDNSIPVSIHAGEWNERNNPSVIDNLKLACEIGIDRIGHGLALRSCDPTVIESYRDKGISIEVCLTSNCANHLKCKSFKEHPISMFLAKGLKVAGLNVDNLLLSGSQDVGAPDPTNECVRALLDCRISPRQLLDVIKHGYECGFAKPPVKFTKASITEWETIYLPRIEDVLKRL